MKPPPARRAKIDDLAGGSAQAARGPG